MKQLRQMQLKGGRKQQMKTPTALDPKKAAVAAAIARAKAKKAAAQGETVTTNELKVQSKKQMKIQPHLTRKKLL